MDVSILLGMKIKSLLFCLFSAQSEVIVPSQPVVSLVGEDVVLPCHLDPFMNAFDMFLEWARPDLNPRFVLSGEGKHSLKLSKVKVSDEGGYKCVMSALSKASSVQLVVGSVSSPVLQVTKNNNGVLLECESADWYPEPEMFWLDGEGNLLSAEPTETVRGPDGLYTVSSRVTVEKRHGRKFTCRVTQRKINQTREKHLTIPGKYKSLIIYVITELNSKYENNSVLQFQIISSCSPALLLSAL
uniref:Ig-like domain-containing protein n=1 Tax=Labrus bergylta TaxID=56723 RepID=A0A3Q3FHL8_9LABR